jgi:hypothetical protein
MKSWSCPWFPFVLELLREAAARSPSPLAKGGYRGVPMARQHDTRQPAPGGRDGHGRRRGAWSDKASGTGYRDGCVHSSSHERRRGGRSYPGCASPRSPRWDNLMPCLVPHTGNGAPVVRGLVSTRRGSEEWGANAPFWPGARATRLQHAAPFGSWLQGPGANLHWGRGDEARGRRPPRRMKLATPVLRFAFLRVGFV